MKRNYAENNKSNTIENIYVQYRLENLDNSLYLLDRSTFKSIIDDFISYNMDLVINNGMSFKFGSSIGELFVHKKKIDFSNKKTVRIDFKSTREMGRKVYHLNEHSDGFNYLFRWKKIESRCPYLNMYEFVPSRRNKRDLASSIKNKKTDYIVI